MRRHLALVTTIILGSVLVTHVWAQPPWAQASGKNAGFQGYWMGVDPVTAATHAGASSDWITGTLRSPHAIRSLRSATAPTGLWAASTMVSWSART
jgi:hypothetical protein